MNVSKISTTIILFLFFIGIPLSAEKIYCRKYSGNYKAYVINVMFSQSGKMLVEVDDNDGGGYFSTPGSYSVKEAKIEYFYKGLMRTIYFESDRIKATPYTFDIEEDYKTIITLPEDKPYSSACR